MISETIHRHDKEGERFELGERLLYLRTPNFTGKDVEELQTALGALGFACGGVSGTFGAYTEGALRKFQLNMGLAADGIAGVNTYAILRNLHNAWMDKPQMEECAYMGFARAADVLEQHAVCLFGTEGFTRKVASYMSNLAMATNPRSKMVSAETLLVPPDSAMLLAHIVGPQDRHRPFGCPAWCATTRRLSASASARPSMRRVRRRPRTLLCASRSNCRAWPTKTPTRRRSTAWPTMTPSSCSTRSAWPFRKSVSARGLPPSMWKPYDARMCARAFYRTGAGVFCYGDDL